MTPDDIKKIITEMFARYETDYQNPAKVLENVHDDVEWWIAGKSVHSGTTTKAGLMATIQAMPTIAEGGMRITPRSFVIEGNRAAVEGDSHLKLKNGKVYANQYHWFFEFRDGKIARAKEYMDTAHILETFGTG